MHVLQSSAAAKPRVFIFLFQLGGPKTLVDIPDFLRELFDDVLPLPALVRRRLAGVIARRRTPEVEPLYAEIGGGSPLLANTEAQAEALVQALAAEGIEATVALAMRYAPPRLHAALHTARSLDPNIPWVALPLYPQYSYATTRSSLDELYGAMTPKEAAKLHVVEAYPAQPRYLDALADTVVQALQTLPEAERRDAHVLFSAHGLPLRLIKMGDPYPRHIAATREGVLARLAQRLGYNVTNSLSYQSRVGPVKWLEPSTEATLIELGKRRERAVLVVPIAFVSEHIETLHELGIQLRDTAKEAGIAHYAVAPTVSCHPAFIQALCEVTKAALTLGPMAQPMTRTKQDKALRAE